MTIVLLLVLVVPLYFGITTIVGNVKTLIGWSKLKDTRKDQLLGF